MQYKSKAYVCKIVYEEVETFTYFFNDENMKRGTSRIETVSLEECHKMRKYQSCRAGKLSKIGDMWQTNNEIDWDYPGGGFSCCYWKNLVQLIVSYMKPQ